MLEIAICDDEIQITSFIENMLSALSRQRNIDLNIDIFYDGTTLLHHIKQGQRYDLIYLDIEMKLMDGIKTAQKLREIDTKFLLIYVTGYENFAKEAFEVDAFRFLTKPIDCEKFKSYFEIAVNKLLLHPQYFEYKFNRTAYRIPLDQIIYFQSDKRITYITTEQETMLCYEKLNSIEKYLHDKHIYFCRIHQSFLINPLYVKKYRYDMLALADGTEFTISEKRRKTVNDFFCQLKGDDIIVS